jgi:TonB family protein
MRIYILAAFLLLAGVCTAQKKHNVYFLKNDGRYVSTRDSADYLRVVEEPDSGSKLYNVFEYYLSGKKKSAGQSARIDPPAYEGTRMMFDSSGNKREMSFYNKEHQPEGNEYFFYPNGKPCLILQYLPDAVAGSEFNKTLIMTCYDSTGVATAENGNGTYKLYDYSFKNVVESGTVKNGKRDGKCEGSNFRLKDHFVEEYKDGELLSGISTDSTGKTTPYTKGRYVDPSYPGGVTNFYKYLSKKIHYPDKDKENNVTGVVLLSFVVERDGKVTTVKVLKHVSADIDAEAVRVMKASPPWIPGSAFGRPERVWYSIPIGFSLQSN